MTSTTLTPLLNVTSDPMVTPFRLSPPREIWGLPVPTFSYMLLGVGGVAPILFILLVIVSMKCYGWRQAKKRGSRNYLSRSRSGRLQQEVWDVERRLYLQQHPDAADSDFYGSRNVLYQEEESGEKRVVEVGGHVPSPAHKAALNYKQHSPQLHSARLSNSNPNVYFMQTPVLQLHRNSNKNATNVDKQTRSSKKLSQWKKVKKEAPQAIYRRKVIDDLDVELTFKGQGQGQEQGQSLCESLPGIESSSIGSPPPPPPPPPPIPETLPHSMTSITSDEAEALHCFDTIYLEPLTVGRHEMTAANPEPEAELMNRNKQERESHRAVKHQQVEAVSIRFINSEERSLVESGRSQMDRQEAPRNLYENDQELGLEESEQRENERGWSLDGNGLGVEESGRGQTQNGQQ